MRLKIVYAILLDQSLRPEILRGRDALAREKKDDDEMALREYKRNQGGDSSWGGKSGWLYGEKVGEFSCRAPDNVIPLV